MAARLRVEENCLVWFDLDNGSKEHISDHESLLEETLEDSKDGKTSSLLENAANLDDSRELLEQTLVEESPTKRQGNEEYEDDFDSSSHASNRDETNKVRTKKICPTKSPLGCYFIVTIIIYCSKAV